MFISGGLDHKLACFLQWGDWKFSPPKHQQLRHNCALTSWMMFDARAGTKTTTVFHNKKENRQRWWWNISLFDASLNWVLAGVKTEVSAGKVAIWWLISMLILALNLLSIAAACMVNGSLAHTNLSINRVLELIILGLSLFLKEEPGTGPSATYVTCSSSQRTQATWTPVHHIGSCLLRKISVCAWPPMHLCKAAEAVFHTLTPGTV